MTTKLTLIEARTKGKSLAQSVPLEFESFPRRLPWLSGQFFELDEDLRFSEILSSISTQHSDSSIRQSGWSHFIWKLDQRQIDGLGLSGFQSTAPFAFRMRESGNRVLLLSAQLPITQALIDFALRRHRKPRLPSIKLMELICRLEDESAATSAKYRLGVVHAKTPGFGNALRNIAFYGDDLLSADYFHSSLSLFDPHRVGVQKLTDDRRMTSVSAVGEVWVSAGDSAALSRLDEFIRFLTQRELIVWAARQS